MVLQAFDAWRTHKVFHKLFTQAWPGLNRALAIFGVYCVAEFAWVSMNGASHEHVDATAHGPSTYELMQLGTSKAEVMEAAVASHEHGHEDRS
jgi:hypothetical protein